MLSWPRSDTIRHDTTTVNFIHSWFMNRLRVVFTFFRLSLLLLLLLRGNSRRRRCQIKCQKTFTIVFSVTLYLHTHSINLCVFLLLFFFAICDLISFLLCIISYDTIPRKHYWQNPFELAAAFNKLWLLCWGYFRTSSTSHAIYKY